MIAAKILRCAPLTQDDKVICHRRPVRNDGGFVIGVYSVQYSYLYYKMAPVSMNICQFCPNLTKFGEIVYLAAKKGLLEAVSFIHYNVPICYLAGR